MDAAPWDPARLAGPRCLAIADLAARFPAGELPSVAALDEGLRDCLGAAGLRLVEADATRQSRGNVRKDVIDIYEVRCAKTGEIPCRAKNLHDVCNALSWAAFPHAKLRSTSRIAELLLAWRATHPTLPNARERDHDRLALLDEGGLLVLLGSSRTCAVVIGHAIWQHEALGQRLVRAARVELPAECPATTSPRELRAATDAAWRALVETPGALERAMSAHAGVALDDHELSAAMA